MSSELSPSQKSTASLLSQGMFTERHDIDTEQQQEVKRIEQYPIIDLQDKQKKNTNIPSRFQQLRLGSMDLGTPEVRETKLQQYNAHMQEVQDLLNQERLYLTQPGVQQMAIKIFKKQMRHKLEVQFIYKLLQSMDIFEKNTEVMSSEIVTRDLVKYFQISSFKKHHKLFDIDQYGDKFYIILSGSVYCLIPDPEKSKTLQKMTNNYTNDLESVLKSKNQAIAKIVKAQSDRPRNSGTISAMNSIIDLDSSRYENKDELEVQFIEQNYPQFKMAKIMQQGESFGEIALLSEDSRRTATVVFREDSWVLSLSKSSFEQIMGNYKINVIEDNLQFLKTFEFFNNIPNQRLLGLLHSMTTHTYSKKTVIYTEKDPSSHIFFLKNGSVEISQLQNTFEQGSSQQIPASSSGLNQKIKIRRKANSQSIHINFEEYKQGKNKNNTSIKPINTESSESEHNTSLNRSLKDKEKQITCFMTKEKNKSQKRIAIACLGKGSYFGEDEILIHKNPKRKSQALCQTGNTEIFSIEKKKLFDILKEYGQKDKFIEDAKVRNEMRENRIHKMLDNERESKLYSTSVKYYQKNYDQMESDKLINVPSYNKQQEQSLYYSTKNIQTQSISSQTSIGQMGRTSLQIPSSSNITTTTTTTTSGNSQTQINNITNNTSTFLYQPYRRPSMTFVLDEVEKSEEFQKIYQKKKKIMEAKNNVKLFTMKKEQYVFTINKILKEGNFNIRNGSLPHLQEKFQFQHTDHTKKSGIMNKYNIPHSSLKENSNQKENQLLFPSECTSPNMSSRFLTPCQQNSKIQPLQYSSSKSTSMHISYAQSPTSSSNHNSIFLSKQKIDSSTIFNSLLKTKQQRFEEQFLKSAQKKNDGSKSDARQFLSPDHTKQQENNNPKLSITTKSIYNFNTRIALPLQPSSTKHANI